MIGFFVVEICWLRLEMFINKVPDPCWSYSRIDADGTLWLFATVYWLLHASY